MTVQLINNNSTTNNIFLIKKVHHSYFSFGFSLSLYLGPSALVLVINWLLWFYLEEVNQGLLL